MTTLAELKEQADHLGLAPEMVRLYGDLRLKTTWEKALIANKTITVDAVEVSAVEIADTVAEEIDKAEIIPFIPEIDLAECNDRKSTMLLELARQRAIFEKKQAIDCPPPPPPPVIIRPCPIPESPSIPGVEIAKENKDDPTIPGSDRRVKSLGDRLFEKIKEDILRYFEGIKEDLQTCFELNYLENEDHYKEIVSLVELMEWNINNKYSIYDIWGTVPYFKREGFQKLIPFGIHEFFKDSCLRVDHWECTYQTYWFVCEKPAPIPTLSEPYGGIFIPNKMHELGRDIYLWKFPGMVQAENFFFEITGASTYCMVPAKSDLKINLNQPVLVGV